VAIEMAQDRYLLRIHAAAGLDQFPELRLVYEPGDKRNLLPEHLAVMFMQVPGFASGAAAYPGFHNI
jgi:hypothetical protein